MELSAKRRLLLAGHLDLLSKIPAPVNTSLGSIGIFHFEVPIHMTSLLFSTLGCGIEAATACSADVRLRIVETWDKMQTWPVDRISARL